VLLRLQDALICVTLVGAWFARRRWREAAELTVVLLGWALVLGLLDRLTWGGWFHSALAYWRYNWVQGRGELFGTSPATFYLRVLWTSMPLVTALMVPAALLGTLRAPALALTVAVFLGVHSAIPHKELRFILPVLPAAMALAGVGLGWASSRLDRRIPVGLALLAAVISAARFHTLTFGDLGAYEGRRDQVSAYDDFGPVNRLLRVASALPDLCGLKVEATHIAWTGGYTYFHRDAPMYSHLGPPRSSRHYDVVLTAAFAVPPQAVIARDGPLVLARLFDGPCTPDPAYSSDLP
jgi:hypothetical protein